MLRLLRISAQQLLLTLIPLNLKPAFTRFLDRCGRFGGRKVGARDLLDVCVVHFDLLLPRESPPCQAYVLYLSGSLVRGVFDGCQDVLRLA
jgi:hypothetical protein